MPSDEYKALVARQAYLEARLSLITNVYRTTVTVVQEVKTLWLELRDDVRPRIKALKKAEGLGKRSRPVPIDDQDTKSSGDTSTQELADLPTGAGTGGTTSSVEASQ